MPLPTTKAPPESPSESSFTVGWICVLQKEYYAAKKLLDEEYTDAGITHARDDNGQYILGRIGKHNVVLCVPTPGFSGSIEAFNIASMMRSTFPWLRLFLLVGISGGVKTKDYDVRLGDIVLGTKIIPYKFGKELQDGFQYTGDSIKPPRELMGVFTSLEEKVRDGLSLEKEIENATKRFDVSRRADYARPKNDRLYTGDYLHEDGCDCSDHAASSSPYLIKRRQRVPSQKVVLHQGIISSADQVMKNAITRDKISNDTSCICFEMEAAGLKYIPDSLSIRGISDYSDGHKNDAWHDYASLAAAVGARELLRALSPRKLDRRRVGPSPKEVDNFINGAADLVEAYSRKERQDPKSLQGILRKLTERQELIEHLINRDLNDLKNSNKDRGDDPRVVELGKDVIQLKQSQHELKDCFEKFEKQVKEYTISREDYVTREEWERFQQQVETNTAKVADFEQSTEKVMNTMGDLLSVIGEQTGDKGFSFASKYTSFAKG
ncbi:unnamed protein product [Clonostachys solani]|uniref:Nucleoside phosphorylase domain-containing protein n=1 Tax=Clonostachys solani TaxID=160281 RepID=A0A9N9ZE29_9HYPO|nr:unnamed protein product [Clonostachys solani]